MVIPSTPGLPLWARNGRLCNGHGVTIQDIEAELEAVEHRVRESLDSGAAGTVGACSQATLLVQIAQLQAELFHEPGGDAFATVAVADHHETYPVRSSAFRRWLTYMFFQVEERTPNAQAMVDALCMLEGRAVFVGEQHPAHVRFAEDAGVIYIDLGDPGWSVIEVTANGWSLAGQGRVKFVRPRGLQPLPRPERGGTLAARRGFVNVGSDDEFMLIVGWLIGAYCPRGPYTILVVNGEQGSAKTTTCRVLRELVDPNMAMLRSSPRDERDLIIAARNCRVLGLDNLSHVPEWLSDALCRISTGAGFGTRALFTDAEGILFNGQRPILLNGIGEIATRPDLLDRSLQVTLPPIDDRARRDEETFWKMFEQARPRILGAILDAVSAALRNLHSTRLANVPRMGVTIDFGSKGRGKGRRRVVGVRKLPQETVPVDPVVPTPSEGPKNSKDWGRRVDAGADPGPEPLSPRIRDHTRELRDGDKGDDGDDILLPSSEGRQSR